MIDSLIKGYDGNSKNKVDREVFRRHLIWRRDMLEVVLSHFESIGKLGWFHRQFLAKLSQMKEKGEMDFYDACRVPRPDHEQIVKHPQWCC